MADYGSSVNFSERTTDIDTPPSGKAGIFLRDDKALYLKNDDGTVTKFGLAGDAPTAHAESHESGGTDEIELAAGQITTGQVALARGGTNADLSATGGTGQVLKQTAAGGAVTVGGLAESEIPDLSTEKLTSGTLPIGRGGTNATTAADARTALDVPSLSVFNAHGTRHENGGADELALDASQVTSGTLPVGRGGTGATTLTGFVRGNDTAPLTASALASSDLPAASSSGQGAVPTTSGKAEGDRLRVKADLTLEWFTPALDDGKVSKLYDTGGVQCAASDASGNVAFDGDIEAQQITAYQIANVNLSEATSGSIVYPEVLSFSKLTLKGTTSTTVDVCRVDMDASANGVFLAEIKLTILKNNANYGRYTCSPYASQAVSPYFYVPAVLVENESFSSTPTITVQWTTSSTYVATLEVVFPNSDTNYTKLVLDFRLITRVSGALSKQLLEEYFL